MLRTPSWLLAGSMALLTGAAVWAGATGLGLPKPMKKPISIRENSVRTTTGHHRTRYFVGGGVHGGK